MVTGNLSEGNDLLFSSYGSEDSSAFESDNLEMRPLLGSESSD